MLKDGDKIGIVCCSNGQKRFTASFSKKKWVGLWLREISDAF